MSATDRPPRVPWRVLGLSLGIAAIIGLAFLVGRPHGNRESVAVTYASPKGPRPPGLKIFLQRGRDLAVLDPATELHGGDVLRFIVRATAPHYLVVRVRDGAGHERVFYPPAGAEIAALVRPEEALPHPLAIDDTPGKETITALFASHAFPVTTRAAPDVEVATVDLMKAP